MPFEKGDPKPPNSGRKKGVKNKLESKAAIREKIQTVLDKLLDKLISDEHDLSLRDQLLIATKLAPFGISKADTEKINWDSLTEEQASQIVDEIVQRVKESN